MSKNSETNANPSLSSSGDDDSLVDESDTLVKLQGKSTKWKKASRRMKTSPGVDTDNKEKEDEDSDTVLV